MEGASNLVNLIRNMEPELNMGEYVFCTVSDLSGIALHEVLSFFKEKEGVTIVIKKSLADKLLLPYNYVASWITLNIHSSLDAVGLTAAFSEALSVNGISCNVIAAYYHDHIFVNWNDAENALKVLKSLSVSGSLKG